MKKFLDRIRYSFFPYVFLGRFLKLFWKLLNLKFFRKVYFESLPKNIFISQNCKDGLSYIINSSDKIIGNNIFLDRISYGGDTIEAGLKILNKRKFEVFFDIGANLGSTTLYCLKMGYADLSIAFEPDPLNFKLLKTNLRLNDFQNKVYAYNIALSDKKGILQFEKSTYNFGDHRVKISNELGIFKEDKRKIIKVKAEPLGKYLDQYSNSDILVKIDTQGFEGHILSGVNNFFDLNIPLITEFSPYLLSRTSGFEKLLKICCTKMKKKFVDIRNPNKVIELNQKNLRKLSEEIGFKGGQTDLIIY